MTSTGAAADVGYRLRPTARTSAGAVLVLIAVSGCLSTEPKDTSELASRYHLITIDNKFVSASQPVDYADSNGVQWRITDDVISLSAADSTYLEVARVSHTDFTTGTEVITDYVSPPGRKYSRTAAGDSLKFQKLLSGSTTAAIVPYIGAAELVFISGNGQQWAFYAFVAK